MKLKLSELKPNPFKKQISKGELNKEQVNKIKANIKELGFFGSLPIFKKDDKYYLIAGHHRVQALKEVYGKDYLVEAVVSDYNEDQVFKGMVIENITQRGQEFRELNENIVAIETYINSHSDILKSLRDSRSHPSKSPYGQGEKMKNEFKEKATASDIGFWIDKKTEEVISHDVITQNLNIFHKLDIELRKGVEKKHDKTSIERAEDSLNYTQAVLLSGVDKEEQKPLAKVLKESREQRVREQSKLISRYKEAPEEVKEQIKKGIVDLADIELAITQYNLKQKNKEKILVQDVKKKIDNLIGLISFSISDSEKALKENIRHLSKVTEYISEMSDGQKARFKLKISNFTILLSKIKELLEKIEDRI